MVYMYLGQDDVRNQVVTFSSTEFYNAKLVSGRTCTC